LVNTLEIDIRFSEVDSLGVVWHGHYVQYFEDGREAFGKQYGLGYLDFFENGYVVPVVNIQCDYKKFLRYGSKVLLQTTFIPQPSAKISFVYRLLNADTNELIATGSTLQVFLSRNDLTLQLITPAFFQDWKVKHGLT